MLQTQASTRIGFEFGFRFGPFRVQIHFGLNLIKDWTLWVNPWLTNGLIEYLIHYFFLSMKSRLFLADNPYLGLL